VAGIRGLVAVMRLGKTRAFAIAHSIGRFVDEIWSMRRTKCRGGKGNCQASENLFNHANWADLKRNKYM